MLGKEYVFKGSHADKVNALKSALNDNNKQKLFNRSIDILIVAPVIGVLYNRTAELDKSNDSKAKVFSETLIRESEIIKHNFKTVILLEKRTSLTEEEKIEKVFRTNDIFSDDNMNIFNSYARGGVDLLYEKILDSEYASDDYTMNLFEFLESFEEKYNKET